MFKILIMSILVMTNIFAQESEMQFFLIEVNQDSNMRIEVNDITIFDSGKGQPNGRYILNNYLNNGDNDINLTIHSNNEIQKLTDISNKLHIYKSNSNNLNKVDEVIYKLTKDDLLSFKEKKDNKYIYTFSIKVVVNNFFTWKFKNSESIVLNDENKAKIFTKIKELEDALHNKNIEKLHKLFYLKNKENAKGTYREIKDVEKSINHMFNSVFEGKSLKIREVDQNKIKIIFEADNHIVDIKLNEQFPLLISSDGGRMGIPLRFIKDDGEYYFYK